MSLRICLVSAFAWSQPHDVNEHVAGVAAGLRELGYHVTILAPSTRASDLVAGRRALLDGGNTDVIALGPAVPEPRAARRSAATGGALSLARGARSPAGTDAARAAPRPPGRARRDER